MIGPIPLVFGSDRETTKALMILGILLVVALLVLFIFQIL